MEWLSSFLMENIWVLLALAACGGFIMGWIEAWTKEDEQ